MVNRPALLGVVLVVCGVAVARADGVREFNITKGDPRVKALERCGDNGNCFSIDLSAPGRITHIEFKCEGEACGWVHPCPDGGNCNQRANEYEVNGNQATWYGWTNSGNPRAVYKFRIHHE